MFDGSNIACVYHICRWIEIELSNMAANLACGKKGDRHLFFLGRTKVDQSKFPVHSLPLIFLVCLVCLNDRACSVLLHIASLNAPQTASKMTYQIVKLQLIYSKDERHLVFRTRDFLLIRSLWLFESFVASQLIGFLAWKTFRPCSHCHQGDHTTIPLFFALEIPIEKPPAHHSPQNLPCDPHESFLYPSYPYRTQY